MSTSKKSYRSSQPSLKYRLSVVEGVFFEIGELVPEEYTPSPPDTNRKTRIKAHAKQTQILSTAELISSLNQIWNYASSIAIPQQQTNLERARLVSQKEDILVKLGSEENGSGSISADRKYFCIDLRTARQLSSLRKPNFDIVKITKKMSMFESSNGNINPSFYQGLFCGGSDFANEDWKGKGLAAVGFSYEFGNIYKWMRKMIPAGLQHFVKFPEIENKKIGAFAGIFVSLCLHPIDTVKTVIQSCHAEQKSIFYIGRSIISERGFTGLYSGIASNIASSAPISALYTFSYESVKGALLPLLPKEYHSLAHCMAGGCASVATSFIFTPSERIKQQMQVGAHYQNCWNALVEIIRKGGLPSLYTGWGAVLCRNIPNSIIKFYTYESLKQVMLTSLQSPTQLNTLQTLVCGALSGSTAAFFTTPFDVVKTRLQTQIPGSLSRYNNVYHALQDIWMHEGLSGLSRGLIPRLVMYTTQGALFFASYESFKQLLSLERPQLTAHEQEKENKDDSTSQLPSSSPSRLHSCHS
ncbi:uncharacterized protein LOC105800235 isoform X2 [Gossypium raimondii]|uniref:Uncharacterized protein n=1 Tax=Gossypium raimondii TaxID=29730 RepID=A0A0D2QE84_GOSRA|nr:uncharacterized protein LOC105800235 isoform X2 [Gossypium raimondii]KJB37528.1 hypothetical protein B456_006G209300 [Gossypium raimondii]